MHRAKTAALISTLLMTFDPVAARAEWVPWNGRPLVVGQKFAMLARGHCGADSPDAGSGGYCGNGSDPIPPGWAEVAADGYLTVGSPQMSPPERAVFTVTAAAGLVLSFSSSKGPVHAGGAGDTPFALRSGDAVAADAFALDGEEGSLQLSRPDRSTAPVGVSSHAEKNGLSRPLLTVMEDAAGPGAKFTVLVQASHLTLSATYGTISGAGPDCSSTCVSPALYPGTPVTLRATTTAGYHFIHWGGLCESQKTDVCTLPDGVSSDGEVSATFSTQYELTVRVQGPGEVLVVGGSDARCSATVPCVVPFVAGLKVPVMSLRPKDVVAWAVSTGQVCQKSRACDVEMNGNVTVVAKYTGQHCPVASDCPAGNMTP